MLSLINKIRSGQLWTIPGGVHPTENKQQSTQHTVVTAQLADEFILPLKQHVGQAGDLLVKVGDTVLTGQPLTAMSHPSMLPVHAPCSGTVTAIEPRTVAHPSGLSEPCIVIQSDGKDTWYPHPKTENYRDIAPEILVKQIQEAGIAGLGGAGYPTAKKIHSGLNKVEFFIVNAAECEPYITADDALMRAHAQEIIDGIRIVEHILQPKLTIIGIEDNKPEAIRALQEAAKNLDIVIRVFPTSYPSGGSKQLITLLTGIEVPSGHHSAEVGIIMQNVGTVHAIKRAIIDGEPSIQRVVTLTGDSFKQPGNAWVRFGTPIQCLLDEFGAQIDQKLPRLILGGSMMGFTLPHTQVPIVKIANCILAPTYYEMPPLAPEMACIRCGQCAEACPVSLLPQQMYWYARSQEYDKLEEYNLKDCMECGACVYVCPSDIPLVHYYRQAKAEIRINKAEAQAAERAKERFEERNARLEQEKQEREQRFKQAAETRRQEMQKTGDGDAVAAAIARVKAKQATETSTVKPAIALAIAKAKAQQASAQDNEEPDNTEMAKLREERKRLARERKAQHDQNEATPNKLDPTQDKKAAVAAAIARAKAKKAEQDDAPTEQSLATTTTEPTSVEPPVQTEVNQDKKAAVAAAIARAKAKKAAQDDASTELSLATTTTEPTPIEPPVQAEVNQDKKAAVAAAIARAKAKKAAQSKEND